MTASNELARVGDERLVFFCFIAESGEFRWVYAANTGRQVITTQV